jgi:teichuronic acid biosynthesis glycosyltransferase TuaC
MKVLITSAMYPTSENPAFGSFIRTQVESLRQAGVEIELLVLEGRPRKLIYPKGIIQLRKRLANGSIDLVHAHYSYVGMVARTQWKAPVVVTYHGDDLLGTINARGKQTHFSKLVVAAGQRLAQLADAVIVQSQEMANKVKRPDVYIIPHEVEFEVFQPVDRDRARKILGLHPRKNYLLFAANPEIPVKRFPLAKAVTEYLNSQDPSIELLVIYKETQDRLALYMNACDALVFPSYQEGSPNIVKQAMACNLPIVATDVGDVRQVIGNTKGCYICNPDVTEFATRLNEILKLGERTQGRQNIHHFDCLTVSGKILQVYEETLKKHRSRRIGNVRKLSKF